LLAKLETKNLRLEEKNGELELKVAGLDKTEEPDFIAEFQNTFSSFDEVIKKISNDQSLSSYEKKKRIRDWENLRDRQIYKYLEEGK